MDNRKLQLCRVCLISGVTMHRLEGSLLDGFCSVMHSNNYLAELPKFVCYECCWLIHKFVRFRLRCQRAQDIFLQLLNDCKVVTKQKITNEQRKYVQSSLSINTTNEDNIINMTYNDDMNLLPEDDDWLVKEEPASDAHNLIDDWLMKEEPVNDAHNFSDDDCTPLSQLGEVWIQEIKPKKSKLNLKKTKHKKLKVIQKEPKEGRKKTRDENGLTPDELDLKTHFTITVLSFEEQKEEIERRKESSNYLQSPYKCDVCYKGFLYHETWANHNASHQPGWGAYECPVCRVRYPSERALTMHGRSHERSYACTMCHFVTRHFDPAKKHKLWHEGVTYKCQQCGEVSSKLTSHLSHVRIKHPSPFVCSECGFSFISDKGLKMHVARMHRDDSSPACEKPASVPEPGRECAACGLTFRSEAACRRHCASQHTTQAHLPLCRSCGVRFPSTRELRAHNAAQHAASAIARARVASARNPAPATYPAPCERCGAEILDRKQHWRHYQKHHHELAYPLVRNYICEICGKGFKSNAYLVYHRRTHFPERLYRCAHCPKSFHNRGNLSLHLHTHTAGRPHACPHCDKGYKTRLGLSKHMRSHDSASKEKRRQRKQSHE